jgi:hypothetical protein
MVATVIISNSTVSLLIRCHADNSCADSIVSRMFLHEYYTYTHTTSCSSNDARRILMPTVLL